MRERLPRTDVARTPADGTPLVCTVTQDGAVLGYVAIDSTVAGRAQGGLRLLPDVDAAELQGLARAMTLKYGLLGLPQGGAKAGVRGDPDGPSADRQARLRAFGQAIAPLLRHGLYVPGADMGTDQDDIVCLLSAAGLPPRGRQPDIAASGRYTATTVFAGIDQALQRQQRPLAGQRIAVEGFGKVGQPLASRLAAAGARVVAISTSRGALYQSNGLDVARLVDLAATVGSAVVEHYAPAERLPQSALLELPVDVLCPCARHESIHAGNMERVTAGIIVPGANTPITAEAEASLTARGVVCLPDFVTNAGGVLGGTMSFAGLTPARIMTTLEQDFGACIGQLLAAAEQQRVSPRQLAEAVALRRHARVRERAEQPSAASALFGAGLALYRHGWAPSRAVVPLAERYFARLLTSLTTDLREERP